MTTHLRSPFGPSESAVLTADVPRADVAQLVRAPACGAGDPPPESPENDPKTPLSKVCCAPSCTENPNTRDLDPNLRAVEVTRVRFDPVRGA